MNVNEELTIVCTVLTQLYLLTVLLHQHFTICKLELLTLIVNFSACPCVLTIFRCVLLLLKHLTHLPHSLDVMLYRSAPAPRDGVVFCRRVQ